MISTQDSENKNAYHVSVLGHNTKSNMFCTFSDSIEGYKMHRKRYKAWEKLLYLATRIQRKRGAIIFCRRYFC